VIVVLFVAAFCAEKGPESSIQHDVETLLSSKKYAQENIGIMVFDVDRKTTIAHVCADSMFNPASVSKLVTAAAAFEKLGPQFTFKTKVFVESAHADSSGINAGNLYIQGGGDPGFTAERLWLFVEHLYHSGLRKVTGDIVIDDFLFDSLLVGPGFDEDSGSRAYQPFINALAVNFNCVAIHVRPGPVVNGPVAIDLFPEIAGIKVASSAVTAPKSGKKTATKGKKNGLECMTLPDLSAASAGTGVTVEGSMKADDPGVYTFCKLWRPWESFGCALRPLLARRGISFKGAVIHARAPKRIAAGTPFDEFESLPLSAPVNDMFKYSSNFTAEMVFKTLSARLDTTQGSWERSSALVTGWWKEQGLPGAPVIKNGSGLGNSNKLSAAQIVALLSHVWEQKSYCPDYLAALSNAGIDGTLKSRFLKSKLKGIVRAKTGTLNDHGVSALAGYILLPRGPLAFAVLCNATGHTQYEDWTIQEQVVETVAEGLGMSADK
jgi:D-alanyl-D-alanine carboxypeptidase/D-alanyl-D-alanine-endopeptidase (penicillin-binding protein 4)